MSKRHPIFGLGGWEFWDGHCVLCALDLRFCCSLHLCGLEILRMGAKDGVRVYCLVRFRIGLA